MTIIRTIAPVNLIIHYPKTEEGRKELANQVSTIHTMAVTQRIKAVNCPTVQKLELLNAVIDTVSKRSRERT